MKISRRFTTAGQSVFDAIDWTHRSSRITNPDGSTVFEMNDADVPASWSQLATDIMVSKYFRKAGVPQVDPKDAANRRARCDNGQADHRALRESAKQVIHRLAGCWRHWGESTATSTRRRTRRRSTTSWRTCCCTRWRRRTARSGSTPG
jgi:ribonucleoside-diphosphate reductase alpha chain